MADNLEAKICVLGAQGVGKTSLVNRYISNISPSPNTPATVGASFLTKSTVDAETGIQLKLQLWDTAGQERYRSIAKLYYRGASAVILVYDITSQASFLEMQQWMGEVREQLGYDVLVHVVGTMSDVVQKDPERRQVEMETVIAYVAETLVDTKAINQDMERHTSRRSFLLPPSADPVTPGTAPGTGTTSKRHSGFGWETGLGWDLCHEVSAESGEGVDEVFLVITRKLVERYMKLQLQLLQQQNEHDGIISSGGTAGITPYSELGTPADYFGRPVVGNRGSFRLGGGGDMSKRRTWLGLSRANSYNFRGEQPNNVDISGNARSLSSGCC